MEWGKCSKICKSCTTGTSEEDRKNGGFYTDRCCLTKVLSEEPDFKNQKEWLTEVVETGGCEIIYYPKYHCELNFIEMVWGWLKSYHRRSCTYSFKHLEETLPVTIEETMPVAFVRRTFQHCFRFMSGYRVGLTGAYLEFAVKKFTSHRAIPAASLAIIKEEFESKGKKWTSWLHFFSCLSFIFHVLCSCIHFNRRVPQRKKLVFIQCFFFFSRKKWD